MFNIITQIIDAEKIKQLMPLTENLSKIKKARDEELKKIIAGKDKRKIFIVGPCSADNEDSVCDYVTRLARVAEKVKDKLMLLPRIYTNKPRTKGEGYKGMMHSPDPKKGTDIQAGIMALRHMHIRVISESGLSGADEMLYPDNFDYIDDVLSYVAIGARSCENQQHRLVASGIDVPVGIKNPMNGSFPVLINSIYAAQIENEFKYNHHQVQTYGNEYAHGVLRGSVDVFGNNIPNYHFEDILKLYTQAKAAKLKNLAVLIDSNHSNSNKNPFEQERIIKEILSNMLIDPTVYEFVKGFIVESYIEDGNQPSDGTVYGKSITDACIGWDKTEKIICSVAEKL